jgi:dihydroxyacetone kinase
VVTDDVSSAALGEKEKRRGIAGDLAVFKIAGAAAEAGYSLDDVERVARLANERTRSLGVAFSGCTLPGASTPLFTVPAGRMAVGLGIHGEPGVGETEVPTADELAALFVDTLLGEVPDGVDAAAPPRVAVILNGLGSVKYEELFVVYRRVATLLEQRGLVIVEPDVGEFCTSFDLAGASLTLLWLDEELETLWRAPADAPAYRKGAAPAQEREQTVFAPSDPSATPVIPPASSSSRRAAAMAVTALEAVAATVDEHADELGRLDAVAGDGDHGIGMQRGARAAVSTARAAAMAGAGAGTVLRLAGDAWADRAGGTSGALWGLGLRAVADRLGDEDAPDARAVVDGVSAARAGITAQGKAQVGDKTMVDALSPFVDVLTAQVAASSSLAAAWISAADAATTAAAATADLAARRGRARTHGDASLGTPDPGAHSFALIVTAIGAALFEGVPE